MSTCWDEDKQPEYYSARGEDCPPRLDANKYEYFADNEEYAYIFTLSGEWVCYNCYKYGGSKMPEIVEIPSGALAC